MLPWYGGQRCNNHLQFDVVIDNTQTSITKVQQLGEDAIVWFTDESKIDAGVRVGIIGL